MKLVVIEKLECGHRDKSTSKNFMQFWGLSVFWCTDKNEQFNLIRLWKCEPFDSDLVKKIKGVTTDTYEFEYRVGSVLLVFFGFSFLSRIWWKNGNKWSADQFSFCHYKVFDWVLIEKTKPVVTEKTEFFFRDGSLKIIPLGVFRITGFWYREQKLELLDRMVFKNIKLPIAERTQATSYGEIKCLKNEIFQN